MNVYNKKRLTSSEKADKEILSKAVERYETCSQVCNEVYRDAIDDIKFSVGEQWDPNAVKDRGDRPCLVENRVEGVIRKILNEQRQHRPMITVTPREDSDEDTAEVINGILRYIQSNSDSDTAFDTACSHQVRGSIGYYRVITDYTGDDGFDQEILIKRIQDIKSVKFPIHLSTEMDFRDSPYCFVESEMSKEDFESEYPDADPDDFKSDEYAGWVTDDKIRVCEYFCVDKEYNKTIYRLSDGTISNKKPDEDTDLKVEDSRKIYKRVINWYKITASTILERAVFPGKWIPVIPVIGDEVTYDNKRKFLSLTRNAKDPQRMLNYWRSAEAERIALAPKAKWVMYEGQDEGFEAEWLNSHKSNNPILHAKVMLEGGNLVPLPNREPPIAMDMAIVNAAREAIDAIKACTGVFDASLGAESNESSGRAILARQREGDVSNYHFIDNYSKSLKHCCRVIVDMIPEIYDTERTIRILGEDMVEKVMTVNKSYDAEGKLYDLSAGQYDVLVETGPSYMSRRQETADTISNLGQRDPVMIAGMRDLLLKYMDLPAEVVERARKTIDPALLQEAREDGQMDTQALQAQVQQAQQMIQQLDQVIQAMTAENEDLKIKMQTKVMDLETKKEIAGLQAKVDLMIAALKQESEHTKNSHEVGMEAMRQASVQNMGNMTPRTGPLPNEELQSAPPPVFGERPI
jgi:hypothetical protein